jgi:hypothetical protein
MLYCTLSAIYFFTAVSETLTIQLGVCGKKLRKKTVCNMNSYISNTNTAVCLHVNKPGLKENILLLFPGELCTREEYKGMILGEMEPASILTVHCMLGSGKRGNTVDMVNTHTLMVLNMLGSGKRGNRVD